MPDVKFSNQYPYTDFHELNLDWVIETVKHWADLVGKTIQSITLTGSSDLVDTYTINYSDGTTSTFTVTNGRGITSIVLTGSLDLVDIYTITYNDGTTSTFQIHNGNGISSIEKTGTSGLIDTYTITFTDGSSTTFEVKNGAEALDATLSLAGYAADAKAVGDALDLKQNAADPAGLADNLTPYSADSGATQSVPFINQGTGCGNGESVVDTGSYAQLKKKLGNTVCVNQLVKNGTFSTGDTTNWSTTGTMTKTVSGGVLTIQTSAISAIYQVVPIIAGHKYILCATISATSGASAAVGLYKNSSSWYASNITADGEKHVVFKNIDASGIAGTETFDVRLRHGDANAASITIEKVWLVDMTLWFGSNDNIPAHLLSHPEDFGRYYSGSLAYNPGQLVNADGSVLKSISRNCWDGEHDVTAIPNQAYYCKGTATITYKDRGGNTISTASVTNDSFTTPADCFSFGVSGTGVTISLYYSGESGYDQYYPYSVLAEVDTGSEVLRSAGAVADEKTPDGTITRKVGVVDLGTLTWMYENGVFYSTGTSATAKPQQYPACARYAAIDDGSDKSIYIGNSGITYVYDSSYTNAAAFQTAMNGVEMTYELLTPTTEQGTSFPANVDIDDFGSMYWTQTNGVPQGVEIFYPYDYKAAVDTLLNMVSGDVDNLATDAELATVAGRVPIAPTTNGTYVLKATVTGGVPTYSWVAE